MCKDLLIIIEVDGYTHVWEDTINKDQKKDKDLKDIGFKVLRFNDEEVLNDMDNVIRTLEYWAKIRRKELNLPPPVPSHRDRRQRGKLNT